MAELSRISLLMRLIACILLAGLGEGQISAGEAATRSMPPARVRHVLKADAVWLLSSPGGERFDASGLLQRPDGQLWTVSDRGPGIYRIDLQPETNLGQLVLLPGLFTETQLRPFAREKVDHYDVEGLTADDLGRIYICDEANRWIMRFDPRSNAVERLAIDWKPVARYFSPTDGNASFEGVAVGGGKIFVANERQLGRIIVVDLATLKVEDDFTVRPTGSFAPDIHYSDLCWFDGALFALLRDSSMVVKIDPKSKTIVAEYDYATIEKASPLAYDAYLGTGVMEGLVVDRKYIWMVTDNNGRGRRGAPNDSRPSLVRCLRPDS